MLSLAMSGCAYHSCRGWMNCNPTCWDKCLIVQPYLLLCLWLWFALVVPWRKWIVWFLECTGPGNIVVCLPPLTTIVLPYPFHGVVFQLQTLALRLERSLHVKCNVLILALESAALLCLLHTLLSKVFLGSCDIIAVPLSFLFFGLILNVRMKT